jgi:hypothetical protein
MKFDFFKIFSNFWTSNDLKRLAFKFKWLILNSNIKYGPITRWHLTTDRRLRWSSVPRSINTDQTVPTVTAPLGAVPPNPAGQYRFKPHGLPQLAWPVSTRQQPLPTPTPTRMVATPGWNQPNTYSSATPFRPWSDLLPGLRGLVVDWVSSECPCYCQHKSTIVNLKIERASTISTSMHAEANDLKMLFCVMI